MTYHSTKLHSIHALVSHSIWLVRFDETVVLDAMIYICSAEAVLASLIG